VKGGVHYTTLLLGGHPSFIDRRNTAKERKLYVMDGKRRHGLLDSMIGGRIDLG